jgi:hypothetical protein
VVSFFEGAFGEFGYMSGLGVVGGELLKNPDGSESNLLATALRGGDSARIVARP